MKKQGPYQLKDCKYCGVEPIFYGQGMARETIFHPCPVVSPPQFVEFDGFRVECPKCGALTYLYPEKMEAIDAWNSDDLFHPKKM